MNDKRSEDFGRAIERMLKLWDRLSAAIAEMHPELSKDERDDLTHEGMDLVMKGLTDQRLH